MLQSGSLCRHEVHGVLHREQIAPVIEVLFGGWPLPAGRLDHLYDELFAVIAQLHQPAVVVPNNGNRRHTGDPDGP